MLRKCPFLYRVHVAVALVIMLCAASAVADSAYEYSIQYLVDDKSQWTIDTIRSEKAALEFQQPGANGLSFGWDTRRHWIVMDWQDKRPDHTLLLEIPWPLLDTLNIYMFDENGKEVDRYLLGDHQPFFSRPIFDAHFIVPFPFGEHSIETVYFEVQTTSSLQLPMNFRTQEDFFQHRASYLTVQGIFYGFLLVMICYNLFIFFSVRRTAYLHYVFFVASFGVLQIGLKGTGFQYLWQYTPWLNNYVIATGGAAALLFMSLFARSFLQLEETPRLLKVNNVMIAVSGAFIAASLLVPYSIVITPLTIAVLLSAVTVILMAFYRYRQGYRDARYYLMAWLAMVAGCTIYLFKQLGLLPVNPFTENSMQIGSGMEILLLSFALADRLNTMRARLENANIMLEQQVEERTQELTDALQELSKAHNKLAIISTTDSLSGLKNRYYFDNSLGQEIERVQRGHGNSCLVLIDVDHFKMVNDKWGHVVGDKALKFVADKILHECRRRTDIPCRYGGEEFAIILPETTLEGAAHVAERVCRSIESSVFLSEGERIPLTASAGVAQIGSVNPLEPAEIVRAADLALYNAKQDGRNCVHVFSPNDEKNVEHGSSTRWQAA